MAVITNYSTLQTAVADYLARSDLTTFIPNFIQNAENKLYRSLNLRNEETALSVTVSSNVAAVPTGFKALKFAYIDGTPATPLQWVTLEEMYRDYPDRSATSSTPSVITREGSNFIFGPPCADAKTLKGIYWKKQDPLRTTDPSWYASNAADVLLYGALLEASPFIKDDPRIAVWQQFYDNAVATLEKEERESRYPKSPLVTRTDTRTQQP